ncbi:MAG: hypothetical protein ABIN61_08250 [candidate division WOR-3 bacterium]
MDRKKKDENIVELRGKIGSSFNMLMGGISFRGELVYDCEYNIHLLFFISGEDQSLCKALGENDKNQIDLESKSCFFVPFYINHQNESVFSL